jgi:TolB-like protein
MVVVIPAPARLAARAPNLLTYARARQAGAPHRVNQDLHAAADTAPPPSVLADIPADPVGPALRLRLIGPMQAHRLTGESALPRSRRARAMLAVMAVAMPRAVPRARLLALFWPGRAEEQARASLRQALHDLSESLGRDGQAALVAGRDALALRPALVWTDLAEAERGGRASHALLAGDLLEDLAGLTPAFDRWLDETRARLAATPAARAARDAPPAPPPRPDSRGARLGVAPLRALGSDPADAHLSLGLAEEIATALARFRWIPLVAPQSLARFAEGVEDERDMRERFALDLLLDGTVQRAGSQVRITLTLSDLRSAGEVVWTQRFDGDGVNVLTLQDAIAAEVVARIDPELLLIEGRRAAARPVRDAAAYELLLRAIPPIYHLAQAPFIEAGRHLEEAIAREPDYAAAHAWFALWHVFLVGQGWADDADAAMQRAGDLAERAISLDPRDARGLTIAGHVRAFLHRRVDEAVALHARALALNPNLPMAWVFSGLAHAYRGEHEEALARIGRWKLLSPLDPHAHLYVGTEMVPRLLLGEYDQVVALGRAAIEAHPTLSAHYRPYLAALGHLGREADAAIARARFLRLEPSFTLAGFLATAPYVQAADRARFAEGLRRAGLPE